MRFWTIYDADGKVVSQDPTTAALAAGTRVLANNAFVFSRSNRLVDEHGNYIGERPLRIGTTINVRYPKRFK